MKKYFDIETEGEGILLITIIIITISLLVATSLLPPLPIIQMNIIKFIFAVFVLVWITYLLCGQTLYKHKKSLISNAITDKTGKHITIYLYDITEKKNGQH